jgi:hypothetical protein
VPQDGDCAARVALVCRGATSLSLAILLPTLGACSSNQPPIDEVQSAQLRDDFAQCLQFPVAAVEVKVDSDRRVIATKWVDNVGDGPARSMEEWALISSALKCSRASRGTVRQRPTGTMTWSR